MSDHIETNSLENKGIEPCIPSRKNRKVPIPHDEARYRKRHKIENSFARLKDWRRVATRYEGSLHKSDIIVRFARTDQEPTRHPAARFSEVA